MSAFNVCFASSQPGDGKSFAINALLGATILESKASISSVTPRVTVVCFGSEAATRSGVRADLVIDMRSGRFSPGAFEDAIERAFAGPPQVSSSSSSSASEVATTRKRARAGAGAGAEAEAEAGLLMTIEAVIDVVATPACPRDLRLIEIPDGLASYRALLAAACDGIVWCGSRLAHAKVLIEEFVALCPQIYSPRPPLAPQVLAASCKLWSASDPGEFGDEAMVRHLRHDLALYRDTHALGRVHGGEALMRDATEGLLANCVALDLSTPEAAASSLERLFAKLKNRVSPPPLHAERGGPVEIAWEQLRQFVGRRGLPLWVNRLNALFDHGAFGPDEEDDKKDRKKIVKVWPRFLRECSDSLRETVEGDLRTYAVHALARALGVSDSAKVGRAWAACGEALAQTNLEDPVLLSEIYGHALREGATTCRHLVPAEFLQERPSAEEFARVFGPCLRAFCEELD